MTTSNETNKIPKEVTDFFNELIKNQERLPQDFEKILYKSLSDLYEGEIIPNPELVSLKSQLAEAQGNFSDAKIQLMHEVSKNHVLREALERIASSEAFGVARCLTERDSECVERMRLAEQALSTPSIKSDKK